MAQQTTKLSKCLWEGCSSEFTTESEVHTHCLNTHCLYTKQICRWQRGELNFCNQPMKHKGRFFDHIISHFSPYVLPCVCKICGARFRNRQQIRKHELAGHPGLERKRKEEDEEESNPKKLKGDSACDISSLIHHAGRVDISYVSNERIVALAASPSDVSMQSERMNQHITGGSDVHITGGTDVLLKVALAASTNPQPLLSNSYANSSSSHVAVKNNFKLQIELQIDACNDIFPELNGFQSEPAFYSRPSAIYEHGIYWKTWIRMIYMFGKFGNIPNLEDKWLPTIRSYKPNTGLVPPPVQNEFFKSVFEKYKINTDEALNIYNSIIMLNSACHRLQSYQYNLVIKLREIFKYYAQSQKQGNLDGMLRTEFSFRSIPFASPFRELCVQSLTAFWRAISQIVKQDIFEIVELHPSVPEFIPSTDCSNTMIGMKISMIECGCTPEYLNIRKFGRVFFSHLDQFEKIVNELVWVEDHEIISKICCNSTRCFTKRHVSDTEDGIEQLNTKTYYNRMIVDDPGSWSFIVWVRIGIDPSYVFQPPPRFDDRIISLQTFQN